MIVAPACTRRLPERRPWSSTPIAAVRRQPTFVCYHGSMKTVMLAIIACLFLVTSACSSTVPAPAGTSPGTVATTVGSNLPGGAWARLAPLPTARGEVAAAELSGKIYVVGGLGPGASAKEEYDPAA